MQLCNLRSKLDKSASFISYAHVCKFAGLTTVSAEDAPHVRIRAPDAVDRQVTFD